MTLEYDELLPPEFPNLEACVTKNAFFVKGKHVDTWFEKHSDILIVSFFNLATVGERDVPQPWFYGNIRKNGYSVLGLLAHKKDWYRNSDAPRILSDLQKLGLFDDFRRVLFIGTSMGGYAALTYARLVPGAAVLAFSPQSTLAPEIVPFERRYVRPQRRFDWTTPDYLDAAASDFSTQSDVTIVYDPFTPEDRAHADRFSGDNITKLRAPHMGHQAIRLLKHIGTLPKLFQAVAEDRLNTADYYKSLDGRYDQIRWWRQFSANALARGHWKLTLAAAKSIKTDDAKIAKYLKKVRVRIHEELNNAKDHIVTPKDISSTAQFAGTIEVLNNAIVIPAHQQDETRAIGVLKQDLEWSKLSQSYFSDRIKTSPPILHDDRKIKELSGAHLFGGHFRGHFGHFLFESTSRLWAVDHIREKLDSILYIPFGVAKPDEHRIIQKYTDFFQLLGIDCPVQTFGANLKVTRLYVPELGFGWAGRCAGSPGYRQFMISRLSSISANCDADRLYISRSGLHAHMGGVVGEKIIERNLERLGYEVFHPQKHSVAAQLAKYKGARKIVSLDGSALHLVPFVMHPDCEVAIIKRRSTANIDDYDQQFRGFQGCEIKVIDALHSNWSSSERGKIDFRSVGETEF